MKQNIVLVFSVLILGCISFSFDTFAQSRPSKDVHTMDLITNYISCFRKAANRMGNQRAHDYCACVTDEIRYGFSRDEFLLMAADFMERKSKGAIDSELLGVNLKLQGYAGKCLKKTLKK